MGCSVPRSCLHWYSSTMVTSCWWSTPANQQTYMQLVSGELQSYSFWNGLRVCSDVESGRDTTELSLLNRLISLYILVVHGAPGVETVLKEHRVSNVLPNARSIGRTADNKSWQTTALKEYPVAFCRAIVGLVQAHVQSRGLLSTECLKECPADIQRDFGVLRGRS